MRVFAQRVLTHPLFAGSLVMVVGSNLYNFGQFIYHFLSGRLLGKALYGDLAAVISILGLIFIVQLSLGLTIVKFVASEKRKTAVSNFAKWVNWWSIWLGVLLGVVALILSPFLVEFLNIQSPLGFYLLAPSLLFFIITNTGRSILQGILAFDKYVLSLLSEVAVKLILTAVLVVAGYAFFGAMAAILLGTLSAYLATRISLSSYLRGERGKRPEIAPLVRYSLPVFVQGLALTSMYSTDIVLVKHFFPSEQAGIYASLAILGRVVFFGASPVTNVMFPLIARRHSHGQPYHNILYLSILLIGGIAVAVTALYFLLPELAIGILYGAAFLEGAPFLWWFGIFMGLLAFGMLFTQFYLSIGKTRVVSLFVLAALLQIALIWFIHPDLLTVIKLSILAATLLVLALLLYFPYHHR